MRGLCSCGVQAPECVGSVAVVRGLGCPAACGILVPRPGTEPTFPALEGRFFTTGPPGKSPYLSFCYFEHIYLTFNPFVEFVFSYFVFSF